MERAGPFIKDGTQVDDMHHTRLEVRVMDDHLVVKLEDKQRRLYIDCDVAEQIAIHVLVNAYALKRKNEHAQALQAEETPQA